MERLKLHQRWHAQNFRLQRTYNLSLTMRTPNGEQLQICYSYARLENDDVQERKPYHLEVKFMRRELGLPQN